MSKARATVAKGTTRPRPLGVIFKLAVVLHDAAVIAFLLLEDGIPFLRTTSTS